MTDEILKRVYKSDKFEQAFVPKAVFHSKLHVIYLHFYKTQEHTSVIFAFLFIHSSLAPSQELSLPKEHVFA